MLLKKGPLTANIDVHIRFTFEPVDRATHVIRALDLTIQIPGLLKIAEPLVAWEFRRNSLADSSKIEPMPTRRSRGCHGLRRTRNQSRADLCHEHRQRHDWRIHDFGGNS
jgi:hypothetical protein